ncbi:MAG TPA: hypothetical protein VFR17_01125 [Mycobacterium sp.]|nr:hypothetical protein [Mycobacterium sp.]
MSGGNLEARVSALETRVRELAEELHVSLEPASDPPAAEDNPGHTRD